MPKSKRKKYYIRISVTEKNLWGWLLTRLGLQVEWEKILYCDLSIGEVEERIKRIITEKF